LCFLPYCRSALLWPRRADHEVCVFRWNVITDSGGR
jgi:hypothetical protein